MGEWFAPGESACLCADRTGKGHFVCIFHTTWRASGSRCVFVVHDGLVVGHSPSSAVGVYADRTIPCVRYGQAVKWCASLVFKV